MTKLKILHTADLHISPDRADEKVRVVRNMVEYSNSNKMDLFVIAGDTFDKTPVANDNNNLADLLGQIECPVVVLRGNHDPEGYLDIFDKIKSKAGIYIIHQVTPEPVNINGIDILAMPHVPKTSIRSTFPKLNIRESDEVLIKAVHDVLNTWSFKIKPESPTIMLGHFTVSEAESASGQTLAGKTITISTSLLNNLGCPVMLGHIHKYQKMGDWVVYSGNPCRTRFDETDEKGFVIWEYDKQTYEWTNEFVSTNARELVTIDATFNAQDGWSYDSDINIEGKEVKFRYSIDKSDVAALSFTEIERFLRDSVNFVYEQKLINSVSIRSEDIVNSKSLADKLNVYMDLNDKQERRDEILSKVGILEKELV